MPIQTPKCSHEGCESNGFHRVQKFDGGYRAVSATRTTPEPLCKPHAVERAAAKHAQLRLSLGMSG